MPTVSKEETKKDVKEYMLLEGIHVQTEDGKRMKYGAGTENGTVVPSSVDLVKKFGEDKFALIDSDTKQVVGKAAKMNKEATDRIAKAKARIAEAEELEAKADALEGKNKGGNGGGNNNAGGGNQS